MVVLEPSPEHLKTGWPAQTRVRVAPTGIKPKRRVDVRQVKTAAGEEVRRKEDILIRHMGHRARWLGTLGPGALAALRPVDACFLCDAEKIDLRRL